MSGILLLRQITMQSVTPESRRKKWEMRVFFLALLGEPPKVVPIAWCETAMENGGNAAY